MRSELRGARYELKTASEKINHVTRNSQRVE